MTSPTPQSAIRRGSVVLVLTASLIVLAGFGALVVDVGHARVVGSQIRLASDASAHAATQLLDQTDEGIEKARDAAVFIASNHTAAGKTVALEKNEGNNADGQLVFGEYDFDTSSFDSTAAAKDVNAVQVSILRDDLTPLWSTISSGTETLRTGARSTVARPYGGGAAAVDCFVPLALPSCVMDSYSTAELNLLEFGLAGNSGKTEIGWAYIGKKPQANNIESLLMDGCSLGEASIDQDVELNNGTIAVDLSVLATLIESSTTSWNAAAWGPLPAQASNSTVSPAAYGATWEGPIVIFREDDCSHVQYNQSAPIDGFAWGAIYDVVANGGKQYLSMRLETTEQHVVGTRPSPDAPDYGVEYKAAPVFVQ